MNDTRKSAVWLTLLGFALGALIGFACFSIHDPADAAAPDESPLFIAVFILTSAVYGAVNMGTSALYGIESWSILRATATHFLICVCSSIAFFGTWIGAGRIVMPSLGFCALMAAMFVTVYALIWLIQFLIYKRKVKNLNATLRTWKASRRHE